VNNKLTLSLIIPAYNEEAYIRDCLDAVARQSVMPDEVIVIDNNSTDYTAVIAASYPFVRVVHEPEQGLIPARNRGFDIASGDIIARVDADSIVADDWVARVLERFSDSSVDALTGPGSTRLWPYSSRKSKLWSLVYHYGAWGYFGYRVMWGANMVFRAKSWHQIRRMTASADNLVHEDQDISMCLKSLGHRVEFDMQLSIQSDAQRYWDAGKLLEYYHKSISTIKRSRVMLHARSDRTIWPHHIAAALLRPLLFSAWWTFYSLAFVFTGLRSNIRSVQAFKSKRRLDSASRLG
jgi:glycosyltransferase involved in cell wall biosynthesis